MSTATQTDRRWLLKAVELSRRCPPTDAEGYHVGAIIVSADGNQLAKGFSRDTDPHIHAEESALAKLEHQAPRADLTGATIYSTMEPCSIRKSRPRTCTELILAAGIRRVVYAMREPPLFVECHGTELLRSGGAEVIELADFADLVWAVNSPVLTGNACDGSRAEARRVRRDLGSLRS